MEPDKYKETDSLINMHSQDQGNQLNCCNP